MSEQEQRGLTRRQLLGTTKLALVRPSGSLEQIANVAEVVLQNPTAIARATDIITRGLQRVFQPPEKTPETNLVDQYFSTATEMAMAHVLSPFKHISLYRIGEAMIETGRDPQHIFDLLKTTEYGSVSQAELLLILGRIPEAEELLTQSEKAPFDTFKNKLKTAGAKLKHGIRTNAQADIEHAKNILLNPKNRIGTPTNWVNLAKAQRELMGDDPLFLAKADELFRNQAREAIAVDSSAPNSRYALAVEYMSRGNITRALEFMHGGSNDYFNLVSTLRSTDTSIGILQDTDSRPTIGLIAKGLQITERIKEEIGLDDNFQYLYLKYRTRFLLAEARELGSGNTFNPLEEAEQLIAVTEYPDSVLHRESLGNFARTLHHLRQDPYPVYEHMLHHPNDYKSQLAFTQIDNGHIEDAKMTYTYMGRDSFDKVTLLTQFAKTAHKAS